MDQSYGDTMQIQGTNLLCGLVQLQSVNAMGIWCMQIVHVAVHIPMYTFKWMGLCVKQRVQKLSLNNPVWIGKKGQVQDSNLTFET